MGAKKSCNGIVFQSETRFTFCSFPISLMIFANKRLGTPQNCFTPTLLTFPNFYIHQPALVIRTRPNIAEVPYFPRN